VVVKFRQTLSVSKGAAQIFDMEIFNHQKAHDVQSKKSNFKLKTQIGLQFGNTG
jgi:hypothetical protein